MRLRFLLIIACLGASFHLFAQQDFRFSQVIKSMEFVNPAYNATKEHLNAMILNRTQWWGFDGAPRTYALNVHSPIKNTNLGCGLTASMEQIGLRRNVMAGLSADVRVRLTELSYFAGGLYAGMESTTYDQDRANPYEGTIDVSLYNRISPVIGVGTYYFHQKFQAGLSSYVSINNSARSMSEQLSITANAAYLITCSEAWRLKPYTLGKYFTYTRTSLDVGLMALYKDWVWFGASYRLVDAVICHADVRLTKNFRLGYSFDYSLRQNIESNSHELRLSFLVKRDKPLNDKLKLR